MDSDGTTGIAIIDVAVTIQDRRLRRTIAGIESRNENGGVIMNGLQSHGASKIKCQIVGNPHLVRMVSRKIGGCRVIPLERNEPEDQAETDRGKDDGREHHLRESETIRASAGSFHLATPPLAKMA